MKKIVAFFVAVLLLAAPAFGFGELGLAGRSGGISTSSAVVAGTQRGMAQGMRDALAISGSGNIGSLSHTRHYSPSQGFSRSKVVFATTYQTGTQLQDTDLPDALYFQVALEPTYVGGTSGLATRQFLYTWNGAKFGSYGGPGTNSKHFIESDWLYHTAIASGTLNKFGLWTYVERQSGTGALPSSDLGSSFVDRGEGYQTFATTQIASDPALNKTTINAMNAAQIGVSTSLTPAFLIIDYGTSTKVIALDGDSIDQYVGEGYAGSGASNDSLGNALRNSGYPSRGVVEYLGLSPAINLGHASDGMKFKSAIGGMQGRLARLTRANPTHLFSEDNINDLSGTGNVGTIASWAANTMYGYGELRLNGGNAYIVTRGGLSAAATGPTGTAAAITDGQVTWRYLNAAVNSDRELSIYSRTAQVSAAYRTAVPGVKICKAFTTPQTTASSDSYQTTAGQTTSWTPPSIRSKLHGYYIADRTALNNTIGDTWFEPGSATTGGGIKIENGYDGTTANMSSIWGADGVTANLLTSDGTHANSVGHDTIGSAFVTQSPLFNFLLKRDIDPASNDNDPMWLEKAA